MKTVKQNITYFASALALTVGLTSCSDFLEEYSQDLARVESWRDLDEVLLGDGYMHSARIVAAYSGYRPSLTGDEGLDILHFMTDEIDMRDEKDNDYCNYEYAMFPFYTWQQDTGTDYTLKYTGGDEKYWDDLYSRINVCNMVIYQVDDLPADHESDVREKERVKGEAYFLRGLCYFYLANLYAQPYDPATAASTPGVPVKTSPEVQDQEYLRETLEDTYVQILSDLNEAQTLLLGKTAKSKYHASRAAALLMLSRTYLYMQNWEKAIDYANQVLAINNRLQSVSSVAQGDNYVSISSPETIFSMGHYCIAGNFASDSWEDYDPIFEVSEYMISLYSEDDMRRNRYIGTTTQGNYDNAFLKYNQQVDKMGGYTDVSSYCLMRTPEAYLILAEASAYNNDETTAKRTLETFLRTRMVSVPSLDFTGNALIDFIREERAREFLLEGHRWFDLRRYTVCQPYKWSKPIEHRYKYYSTAIGKDIDYIDTYRLEAYDAAYTLPIPRAIREFQVSIGNNPRPARQANRHVVEEEENNDDDWDW